jgi:hypothetical protein
VVEMKRSVVEMKRSVISYDIQWIFLYGKMLLIIAIMDTLQFFEEL